MKIIRTINTFLFTCIISSCYTHVDPSDMNRHRFVQAEAKLHGVNSEQLHNTMQALNSLLIYNIYDPLQAKETMQEQLDMLVQITGEVVESTDLLTNTGSFQDLKHYQISTFRRLSEQLDSKARDIQILVQNNELSEISTAFQDIEKTCIRCHYLFREK